MHIIQIATRIAPGSGIAAVAWHLEREFRAQGHLVERIVPQPKRPARSRLGHRLQRITEPFRQSWVETRRVRRTLAQHPDAIAISHNAVAAGDVYVDHGVALAAVPSTAEQRTFRRIADRLERIAATDVHEWHDRCRDAVASCGWPEIARRYVDLMPSARSTAAHGAVR